MGPPTPSPPTTASPSGVPGMSPVCSWWDVAMSEYERCPSGWGQAAEASMG